MIEAVLVNYRNTEDTINCLLTLFASPRTDFRALVIDNSDDEAAFADLHRCCEAFGVACRVLAAPSNVGFAAGCNLGIAEALRSKADHVLLLNNDTVVPPEFPGKLGDAAARFPGCVVTGRVRDMSTGRNAHSIGRFTAVLKVEHWMDDARLAHERRVEFASGCLMLIPAPVFAKVGLLDERFFMYGEDVEFALRLKRVGIPILYAPALEIRHAEGSASKSANLNAVFYDLRNAVWLAWNLGGPKARAALPFYLASVWWRCKSDSARRSLFRRAVTDGLAGRLGKASL